MFNIAICDDDKDYVDFLKKIIMNIHPEELKFHVYYSGEDLLRNAGLLHEVIFLDIILKGADGIRVAKELRLINKHALLIFCTKIYHPTPEIIEVIPFRYLYKGYPIAKTIENLETIFDKMDELFNKEFLLAQHKGEYCKVNIDDITYLSKLKYGSQIHLVLGYNPAYHSHHSDKKCDKFTVNFHLKTLYEYLSHHGFEFAHDSYLVNCRWVDWVGKTSLKLHDSTELNISRSKSEIFKKQISTYYANTLQHHSNK